MADVIDLTTESTSAVAYEGGGGEGDDPPRKGGRVGRSHEKERPVLPGVKTKGKRKVSPRVDEKGKGKKAENGQSMCFRLFLDWVLTFADP